MAQMDVERVIKQKHETLTQEENEGQEHVYSF